MDLGLIALIFAAALLGPALSLVARGAVPVVVGELLAGAVLGKTGLRVIDPGKPDLALLYSLGFATLMFVVGMNVPLHDQRLRAALRRGALAVAAAVPLALAAGLAAHLLSGGPTLVYAVVIVSSSAAVALPVIEEAGLDGQPQVLTAMAWITVADVLATIAVPLAITPGRAAHAATGALIVAALVAATFLVARRLRRTPIAKHVRKESKRRHWAIDLRLAVTVLVGLSYLADQVGASILVAGFGTGLVVGAIGGPKRLSQEVLGLSQGFLVPLFFVLLGAKLDLRALSGSFILLAAALAGLTLAVHALVSRLIRAPAAVGLLASAQMGVPAAAIALGLPAGALDQGQASAIFCAALCSIGVCSLGASILRRGDPAARQPPPAPAPAAVSSSHR